MAPQGMVYESGNDEWTPSRGSVIGAWLTHLVTASSAMWCLLAIWAINRGEYVESFWWLALAVAIDSFDGILARRFDVKRVLPQIDGALLDNIVDYMTYVFVPAYFLFATGLLPGHFAVIGPAVILLSSAYQFSQADAKTEDHYFKGFPSYWNVVALYMFLLDTPGWFNLAVVILLAILVFVPIKYIYPSRTSVQPRLVMAWSILWGISMLVMLSMYPDYPQWLMLFSLAYVVYYHALSLYVQFVVGKKK
jgi:phosphatidylcholine synthase